MNDILMVHTQETAPTGGRLPERAEIEWLEVPAGTVMLGSRPNMVEAFIRSYGPDWVEFFNRELPQHPIELPAFRLAKTPVTNAQYAAFIAAGGYADRRWWTPAGWAWRSSLDRGEPDGWDEPHLAGASRPVVGVTWYEAAAFARWAGGRLPTEAEWERAAKANGNHLYPWGSQWDPDRLNSGARGETPRPRRTTPVGAFSPQGDGPFGHQDLLGQVWEWTSSLYRPYPYRPDSGPGEMAAREDPYETGRRVLRGGNWSDGRYVARSTCRHDYPQDYSDLTTGIRLAADLEPARPVPLAPEYELVVFARTNFCPDVVRTKRTLYRLGVPYRQVNLDQDRQAARLLDELIGMRSAPTFVLARPGELRPAFPPAPLPAGQEPRSFDRGSLVQEPEEDVLAAWIARYRLA